MRCGMMVGVVEVAVVVDVPQIAVFATGHVQRIGRVEVGPFGRSGAMLSAGCK